MLCPICKHDFNIPYFDLLSCKLCSHIFSRNIYNNEYWNFLYEYTYTSDDRKMDLIRNKMYQKEIEWLKNFRELRGSFLDVGCSFGNFFSFLPKDVVKVGIDVSSYIIDEAKKLHPDCSFHKTSIDNFKSSTKYDYIQFRGVLQHTQDPITNLESALNLLKAGGFIIITSLPDFSCPMSRLFKDKFQFYSTTLCPNFFTRKSFLQMLKSLGLRVCLESSPYINTPYANFKKDLLNIILNKLTNKKSPPFFGNIKNYVIEAE